MIGTIHATAGKPVTTSGYAQDFGEVISAVQFSCDDGKTWTTYPLSNVDPDRNVNWTFSFTPERAGTYELLARAVRADGSTSPEPARTTIVVESGC